MYYVYSLYFQVIWFVKKYYFLFENNVINDKRYDAVITSNHSNQDKFHICHKYTF